MNIKNTPQNAKSQISGFGFEEEATEVLRQLSSKFRDKLHKRIAINLSDKFLQAQCRVCGVIPTECLEIFKNIDGIASLMNVFLPIKVTEFDPLPKTICLECLGILQTMDDLAYRASLVEAALTNTYIKSRDSSSDLPPRTSILTSSKDSSSNALNEPMSICDETSNTLQAKSSLQKSTSNESRTDEDTGLPKNTRPPTRTKSCFVALSNMSKPSQETMLDRSGSRKPSINPYIPYTPPVRYSILDAPIKNGKRHAKGDQLIPAERPSMIAGLEHSYAKAFYEGWTPEKDAADITSINLGEESSIDPTNNNATPMSSAQMPEHSRNDSLELNSDSADSFHSNAKTATPRAPLISANCNGKKFPLAPKVFEISSTDEQIIFQQVAKLMSKEFLNDPSKVISGTIENLAELPAKKKKRMMFTISEVKTDPAVKSSQKPLSKAEELLAQSKVTSAKDKQFTIHGCYICNKKFGSHAHLYNHMQTHSAVDKCCPVCERVFDQASIQPLLNHRKVHSEAELKKWTNGLDTEEKYKCEVCSKFFVSRIHKTFHDIYYHKLLITPCGYCDGEYITGETVTRHRKVCSANRGTFRRSCPICLVAHDNLEAYLGHIQNHAKDRTCDFCLSSFSSSHLLEEHIQIDHSDKPYVCPTCGKSFVIENRLEQHLESFHGKLKYPCHFCSDTFSSLKKLAAHAKTHTDASLRCTVCPEVFETLGDAKKHWYTHSELICHLCNIASVSVEKCLLHMVHCSKGQKVPPETNNEARLLRNKKQQKKPSVVNYCKACSFCHRKFYNRTALRRHETIHTGERPYMCSECGKTFRTPECLTVHSKRHKAEVREYKCPYCPETFPKMDRLHTHKRQKHPDRFKYKCALCNHPFNTRKYFIVHREICKPFDPPPTFTVKKPMRCMLCPRLYTRLSLITHERRPHDPKYPAVCNICDESFSGGIYLLRNHVERHYNDNDIKDIACPDCPKVCADSHELKKHKCDVNDVIGVTMADPTESQAQQAVNSILLPPSPLSPNHISYQLENPLETEPKISTPLKEALAQDCSVKLQNFSQLDEISPNSRSTEDSPEKRHEEARNKTSLSAGAKNSQTSLSGEEIVQSSMESGTVFQCSFCSVNFYDNNIFVNHLENDHGFKLDSLEFLVKE